MLSLDLDRQEKIKEEGGASEPHPSMTSSSWTNGSSKVFTNKLLFWPDFVANGVIQVSLHLKYIKNTAV